MIYIWIAGVFLLLAALMMMKIRIAIEYLHTDDDDRLTFKVRTGFGLLRFKKEIPVIKINQQDMTVDVKEQTNTALKNDKKRRKVGYREVFDNTKQIKKLVEQVINLQPLIRRFMKRIHITKLEWTSVLGFPDAALTGIVTGGAWSLKAGTMALLHQIFCIDSQPEYEVIPVFNSRSSKTHLTCIFHFRVGHAITAAFRIVMNWNGKMRGLFKLPKNLSGSTKNDSSV
ncbi:DUF2953 domain-containing protein [Bacillus paralicheniformis]|uniref:DUF2953 domain-containing protein n=1 Tax=Bacillus paralicheniformis TaxID=1648923 RepID=UPI00189799FE|nr:DUF2953 domain-containing protein [Bacillus paralicheniformis]MEB3129078.1 DUF2953 domain-containing protein [Bacillus paralicheniformis]MED1148848.1 DUF2953 domain-containing protein [Bacillus paralicheniformis]WHH55635.1 DUF2953 domain-containing protein [Bacillus paralicheniformis]